MSSGHFLDTRAFHAAAFRARQRRRLLLGIDVEPVSKGRDRAGDRAFQDAIAAHMRKLRRRAFRADISLELDFSTSKPDPPAIHTLAKNYLDLLGLLPPGRGADRSRLLYDDDRRVQRLAVRFSPTTGSGSSGKIRISARPIRDLIADLELAGLIRRGRFEGRASGRLRDHEERMEDLLRPRDSLADWEFGFGGVERLRPEVAGAIRKAERQHFQQAMFAHNDQTLRRLLMMMLCDDLSAELARDFLHPVALDVGHAPAAKGDSSAFATAVQDAMTRFQRQFPKCSPLEQPISLHVVFTPPAQGIDADNLARKIVPIVEKLLCPPTTLIHTVDLATIDDPRRRQHIERFLEGYRRVPPIAITKYEVMRVPPSRPDPDHGFVKLSLGDGTTHGGLLGPILSHVEEWADKVEHSAR